LTFSLTKDGSVCISLYGFVGKQFIKIFELSDDCIEAAEDASKIIQRVGAFFTTAEKDGPLATVC
jgi:hypothetical protein